VFPLLTAYVGSTEKLFDPQAKSSGPNWSTFAGRVTTARREEIPGLV